MNARAQKQFALKRYKQVTIKELYNIALNMGAEDYTIMLEDGDEFLCPGFGLVEIDYDLIKVDHTTKQIIFEEV